MRWRPRRRELEDSPQPVPLRLQSWPLGALQVQHVVKYEKRPKPDPPDSFEVWIEHNGHPITGRLVFNTYGGSGGEIDLANRFWLKDPHSESNEFVRDIVLRVRPR